MFISKTSQKYCPRITVYNKDFVDSKFEFFKFVFIPHASSGRKSENTFVLLKQVSYAQEKIQS